MWITVSSLKKGMHINSSYHDGEIHKSLLPSGLHSKKCTVGKYPSFVIELLTQGLSWCVYTSDCPQPVNWSAWTSWVKKRWGGRGLVRTTRSGRVHPCCCISRYSLHLVTFWRPWWWWLFSRSVVSNSLWPHGLQHAYPSLSPRVYSDSCSLSQWCHPTISSSITPFSSALSLYQHQGLFQ